MFTPAVAKEYRLAQSVIAATYVLLVAGLTLASAAAHAEENGVRSSTSKHIIEGGRDGDQSGVKTKDSFAPLMSEGVRQSRQDRRANRKTAAASSAPALARQYANDFWIYEADVVLFGDDDGDGFYYGIDLLLDADTAWSSADVYGVLYLSLAGGPWNEYAITEDFRIFGTSPDDEYVLVTELDSGYPTGDYDMLIELYDSVTGEFLTDFGPESSSALSLLPLEDFNRDAPLFDEPVTVVRQNRGGGSMGLISVLLLGAAGLLRRTRSRTQS